MKKALLLCILLSTYCITSSAQSWQWGQRGGSAATPTSGYGNDEDVDDITTDKWGNVYVVTNVWNYNINIAGHSFPDTGFYALHQVCIASFKCDGSFRWSKMMYGCTGKARTIAVDTLGGVYTCGNIYNMFGQGIERCEIRNATTIDTTIIPYYWPTNRSMFVMKLDTGGAFKWIRLPDPDTATYTNGHSGAYDMAVDESGNCHVICALKPGAYVSGAFVANHTAGWGAYHAMQYYVLKYNSNGSFQGGYHLPFMYNTGAPIAMKRDNKRHRNIFSGINGDLSGDTLAISGQTIHSSYVTAFDDNGNMLWLAQQDTAGQSGLTGTNYNRVALDGAGNCYLAGWCMGGYSFNGTVINNIQFGGFVVKLDTAGHNVWVQNSKNTGTVNCAQAAVSGNTVAVWGNYATTLMIWGNDTLTRPTNCGYRAYLAKLNATTGAVIGVDSVQAPCGSNVMVASGGGYADMAPGSITSDRFGNFYMGGYMDYQVWIGNDTLTSAGGEQDWYIAKYGTANCTVPVRVEEINNVITANVKVYPNPTTGEFTISADAAIDKVDVYNVVGARISTKTMNDTRTVIDMSNSVRGVYIYVVHMHNGSVVKGKVTIQ